MAIRSTLEQDPRNEINKSRRKAYLSGFVDGSRLPALMLLISLMSFGSLCRESGLGLDFALAQLATMWALPGQIVFVELYTAGSSIFAISLAVAMANARFMPMTATLMSLLRPGIKKPVYLYAIAHLVSFNGWVYMIRNGPKLCPSGRPAYFVGFATIIFFAGVAGTSVGYVLAGLVPTDITILLLFINVVYFILMVADARGAAPFLAVICGAVLGPLLHLVSNDWGLMLAGIAGGSIAFLFVRYHRNTGSKNV